MIHVIWSGKGFWVAVVTCASSYLANLISNSVTGSGAYWDAHKWPFAVSLFVSAAVCWPLGRHYGRDARVLVDPKTGEQVVMAKSHTLFFVPMVWWGPLLVVFGVAVLVAEFMNSK